MQAAASAQSARVSAGENFGHYQVPERWWGARSWPKLIAGLDPWIVEMLDSHRKIILQIEARMDQLEENTTSKTATLIEEPAVRGLGERTRAQMRAEVSTGTASKLCLQLVAICERSHLLQRIDIMRSGP